MTLNCVGGAENQCWPNEFLELDLKLDVLMFICDVVGSNKLD